ncbi:MAG TPA: hypothetical protein VH682_21495 [Gemmataceae bacterium]|jgi:hypothetical protein
MVELREIVGSVAGLLLAAVRSFLLTLLLMLLLGATLAAASYWILSGRHWVYGLIAALAALAECAIVGVILAAKRAVATTLVHGLRKSHIGSAAVRLIFDRLLGVSAEETHGERGGWATKTAERLPLAQAEKRLGDAIRQLIHAPATEGGLTGYVRRRLQARLLGLVHKLTLASFREEDARHGGVDLAKVQGDLGERIDGLLVGKLRGGVNLWTILVLVGLPVQILALSYVVLALLK